MLEKIKKYKSYIIIAVIVILIIIVFILKQINGELIDDCKDPNCHDHNHTNLSEDVKVYDNEYTLYNFDSEFCYYCSQMKPIYDKCRVVYKDKLNFKVIDIDKDSKTASKYGIYATPMFIIVDRDGKEVDKIAGAVSEEKFIKFIEKWSNK